MDSDDALRISANRLRNQGITGATSRTPEDVVASLGAVQAQEYAAARWGLALRAKKGIADAEIARAVDSGRILRTHVLRPTWHFVTPRDIRWMLALTGPRVRQRMAVYAKNTGLDATTVSRALPVIERALADGQHLTRIELGQRLARERVIAKGMALALITMYAELEGLICSGPYHGTKLTYALLAERAPQPRVLARDEALGELTRRYFASHGPATIRDFVWWSGLTTADAKRGLAMNGARHEVIDGLTYSTIDGSRSHAVARKPSVHMLPIYDEYLVAYRDREAVPHPASTILVKRRRPVMFQHAIVAGGQVAGTWRTDRSASGVVIEVALLRHLRTPEYQDLTDAAARFGRFLELPATVRCL